MFINLRLGLGYDIRKRRMRLGKMDRAIMKQRQRGKAKEEVRSDCVECGGQDSLRRKESRM